MQVHDQHFKIFSYMHLGIILLINILKVIWWHTNKYHIYCKCMCGSRGGGGGGGGGGRGSRPPPEKLQGY